MKEFELNEEIKLISLLKNIETVLNNIPNHSNVGQNGESSYEVVSKLSKYLRNNKKRKEDNPVPSLDKKHIKALDKVYRESQCRDENKLKLAYEAICYLENGIETNKEQPKTNEYHVVYLCGCTDCFHHALFFNEKQAEKWAKENSKNPEGYIIEKQSGSRLLKTISDEEY